MNLLRDRRLAALLGAEVVSSIGTQMTWLALPWFVLRTTGSPQQMTWVIVAEVVPIGVLGFWGGAIAARVGTRRTMLVCDIARAPLLAAIPVLHAAGWLPFPALLALVAATGVFIAPYFAVQRSVVPELVGEEHGDVAYATAFFQAANRLTIFLGPPLAGVLISVLGAAPILYVDAATYVLSFALIAAFVHPPELPAPAESGGVFEGVRFVLHDKLLRVWTPAFTLLDVCWNLVFASLPVLVVTTYHANPRILGWLFGPVMLLWFTVIAIFGIGWKPAELATFTSTPVPCRSSSGQNAFVRSTTVATFSATSSWSWAASSSAKWL